MLLEAGLCSSAAATINLVRWRTGRRAGETVRAEEQIWWSSTVTRNKWVCVTFPETPCHLDFLSALLSELTSQLFSETNEQKFVRELNGDGASWIGLLKKERWENEWKWVDESKPKYEWEILRPQDIRRNITNDKYFMNDTMFVSVDGNGCLKDDIHKTVIVWALVSTVSMFSHTIILCLQGLEGWREAKWPVWGWRQSVHERRGIMGAGQHRVQTLDL